MRGPAFGKELRELFRLAVPLAAAQAGTQLMGLVDIAVIGRLGARELAGAGLANAIFFAFSVAGIGIVFGVDPMISQAVGAGDRVRARAVLWQGVWLALIVSAVLTIPILACSFLLPRFGVAPEMIAPAREYLFVRVWGLAPLLVFLVVRAYLQALGATRPMVVAMLVCNVFNLVFDLVLVFGWGPFPRMGVAGAAIVTVAAALLQLAIVAAAARAHAPPEHVGRRWRARDVADAFRVGWPIGLQMGAEVGVFALVALLAGTIGTLDLAAHQLVIAVASFTYTVALGVAAAGSVRVGLAVGARDRDATRGAGLAAFLGGVAVMIVASLLFALFPRGIARMVSDQPDVIAAALPLMIVAAYFQLSDGIQAVGAGVLRGAGDTRFTFAANLLGHWLIGLPIALLLGFRMQMGIVGMWWGLCAGLTVVAALLFWRFEKLSAREIVPLG